MDPAQISFIVTCLGQGLLFSLEKIVEKGLVDPLLETGFEKTKSFITKGYDKKKCEEDVRSALLQTIDELSDNDEINRYEKLIINLKLTGLNTTSQNTLATLAIEMAVFDPNKITDSTLKLLNLDPSRRALLTKFLFVFRKYLSFTKFESAIIYADHLYQNGFLKNFSDQIINISLQQNKIIDFEQKLFSHRKLGTDESSVLHEYLIIVQKQLKHSLLPLARNSSGDIRVDAELKQIFVPLRLMGNRILFENIYINDLINSTRKFILVGPPGSGKTTLLRRIALAFAEGKAKEDLDWNSELLLPIFIRLRNFGTFLLENKDKFSSPGPGALITYLEQYFRDEYRLALTPDFFDKRLNEGRCFVLLDGLDEVTKCRSEVAQQINAFIRFYGGSEDRKFSTPKKDALEPENDENETNNKRLKKRDISTILEQSSNHFGISSRPKGFDNVEIFLRPSSLIACSVQPLDSNGITQLINNILVLIENNVHQRYRDLKGLKNVILQSNQLTELASTPLFCTALVLVYKYHGAQLPQRRVDVFEEIIDLLLGFWKAQEQELSQANELAIDDGTGTIYQDIKTAVSVKKRRLSYIAYKMQEERITEITLTHAIELLKDYLLNREGRKEDVVADWARNFLINSHERSGLLVEIQEELYSFSHQNFREYLAASEIINFRESKFIQTIMDHIDDDWWEQVILMACAHSKLSEGIRSYVIEELIQRNRIELNVSDVLTTHRIHITGLAARDMGDYLTDSNRKLVVDSMLNIIGYSQISIKDRAIAGDILDSLNWLPSDLYHFLPINNLDGKCFFGLVSIQLQLHNLNVFHNLQIILIQFFGQKSLVMTRMAIFYMKLM